MQMNVFKRRTFKTYIYSYYDFTLLITKQGY